MIRTIWNPWHGCVKKSEGCKYCYMYCIDRKRGQDGRNIYKVKNDFDFPLHKDKNGNYKVKSGQIIHVCLTSDFFVKEADKWRDEAWEIIRQRPDVIFSLLTKRPERVKDHLPKDFGNGFENIIFNITCENQKRADERMPILLELPFKHKGIMCAPLIGKIDISKYLDKCDNIEKILCDGENYDGNRALDFEWVKSLANQAKKCNISFTFCSTGNRFIKDGKEYNIKNKSVQTIQAAKAGLNYEGKKFKYKLTDQIGIELTENQLYKPYFNELHCKSCSQKSLCGGCSKCDKCKK